MYFYALLLSTESGSNTENMHYLVFCICIPWQHGKVDGLYLSGTFLVQVCFRSAVMHGDGLSACKTLKS